MLKDLRRKVPEEERMKLLEGLFTVRLLVPEGYGLTGRIFRKCQKSGVTFPMCEAEEQLNISGILAKKLLVGI